MLFKRNCVIVISKQCIKIISYNNVLILTSGVKYSELSHKTINIH